MRKWLLLAGTLLLSGTCLADNQRRSLRVQTVDGNTSNVPITLKVTNGSLTDNGDGSMSLTTGAGGGGGGGGTVNAGTPLQGAYYPGPGSTTTVSATPSIMVGTSSMTLAVAGQSVIVASNTVLPGTTDYQDGRLVTIGPVSITGNPLNMNSHQINNVTDPTSAQDAATKNYVDSAINAVEWKASCEWATTAALPNNLYSNGSSGVGATLTGVSVGALSVDGNAVAIGDRILVKNEGTAANNGIYTVTVAGSGIVVYVLTRATDFDQTVEISTGDAVLVESGSTNANTSWVQTTAGAITVGTTAINFTQFTGGIITAGVAGQGAYYATSGTTLSAIPLSAFTSSSFTYSGKVQLGGAGNSVQNSSNTILTGTTFYQDNAILTSLPAGLPVQTTTGGRLQGALISISTAVMGTLAAAQEPAHSGDVTNSAGSLAMTAAASQPNITSITSALKLGASGNSVTIASNTILTGTTFYQDGTVSISTPNANVLLNGGLVFAGAKTTTANYSMTCTDSIIFANGIANSTNTLTLPTSCPAGKTISIFKADASSNPVTFTGSPTNTILSTGTITVHAPGDGGSLVYDGSANWLPFGNFYVDPIVVGTTQAPLASSALTASSDTIACPFTVPTPTYGYAARLGNVVQSGNVDAGIYDANGTRMINSGTLAVGAGGYNTYNYTAKILLSPGNIYYAAMQASNVTSTWVKFASNAPTGCYRITGTTMGLPTTITFGTGAGNVTVMNAVLVYGGLAQ